MRIREHLENGTLSTIPVPELLELMAGEVLEAMNLAKSLLPEKQKVSKGVQLIALAPYIDHESDSNCHPVNELPESNLNDVFAPMFRGLP